jgi:hypothetical protein
MFGHVGKRQRRSVIVKVSVGLLLLMASNPIAGYGTDTDGVKQQHSASKTRRVTFIQMSAPHLFDAGLDRHGQGVEEEALDNRAAFHWAVLESNRMVLAEHRTVDFVVITGGFGLQNVYLNSPVKDCECPKRARETEGPIAPVSMGEAVAEVAQELDALTIKRIYLVPGDDDLCDASPADLHRWATFVWLLQAKLTNRYNLRQAALERSYPPKPEPQASPPPEVVDLTLTLERLKAAGDPTVNDLGGTANVSIPYPPVLHGFTLLGLDSAYFSPHQIEKAQTASNIAIPKEIEFLQKRIQPGGSYLIFTHTADIRDPEPPPEHEPIAKEPIKKPLADSGSSWLLPKGSSNVRKLWHDEILQQIQVIGVFGGHFHSSKREMYPHSFTSLNPQPDELTAKKTWLSPPLALGSQWTLPPDKTARGVLLVTVTGTGAVLATPMWFATADEAAAVEGDDKLIQARAEELEGHWDKAADLYQQALSAKDSSVRSTATSGYERARATERTWWWQLGKYLPPIRWVAAFPRRAAWALPVLVALLIAFAILRWLRFLLIGSFIKFLLTPRYRGRALLHPTTEMTKGALTGEFNAQMLAAQEEIRARLLSEQESWMARHVALLAPSSESFDTLVGSIPKTGEVDISGLVKFIVQLARAFQWTVDSGLAVFPPDVPNATSAAAGQDSLPQGGELSAYATLKWAWLTKNSWRRKVRIDDHSAVRELARQLAELILGEAFV